MHSAPITIELCINVAHDIRTHTGCTVSVVRRVSYRQLDFTIGLLYLTIVEQGNLPASGNGALASDKIGNFRAVGVSLNRSFLKCWDIQVGVNSIIALLGIRLR